MKMFFSRSKRPKEEEKDPLSEYRDCIRDIPRRKQITSTKGKEFTASLPRTTTLQATKHLTSLRMFLWACGIGYFFIGTVKDILLRRNSNERKAKRARRVMEQMGPVAIKLGQQLSVRADALPQEFCEEFTKMLDSMPPFPLQEAIRLTEKATGAPLDQTFETFDPNPIGSASLACVYQARLKTGEMVAVKVRRPGIESKMANDIKALSFICQTAEWLGAVRPGSTANFMHELRRMLAEELNFRMEARYMEIFRRESKKYKYVSSPKVYHHLSGDEAIVMELISGVFLVEIMNALDYGDTAAISQLEAKGFNLKKIARMMLYVLWWETWESSFFHADPHPANLIVRPNNTLVMIDFGSCGTVSSKTRNSMQLYMRELVKGDAYAMAVSAIRMSEPLNPVDTEGLLNDMLNLYREGLMALKSKHSQWHEKCSGGMWMRAMDTLHNYNITMNLDSIRMFRATFVYDTIIYRLYEKIDVQKEYKVWHRQYTKRLDKKRRKNLLRRLLNQRIGNTESFFETMDNLQVQAQRFNNATSFRFNYGVNKAAFGLSAAIKATVRCIQFLILGMLLQFVYNRSYTDETVNFIHGAKDVIQNPIFFGSVMLYLFVVVRKILMRIDDVDTK